MKKALKISTMVIAIIIGLAVAGLLFIHFSPHYGLFFVKSSSMEPVIHPGDIVITGPIGGWFTGDLAVGKVATFKQGDAIVTHRITGIDGDELTTKGDANEDPDPHTLRVENIIGLKMIQVPKLGYINSFVSDRRGWFIVIIIPTILLVVWIVKDIVKESLKDVKKEEKKQTEGGEHIEVKK